MLESLNVCSSRAKIDTLNLDLKLTINDRPIEFVGNDEYLDSEMSIKSLLFYHIETNLLESEWAVCKRSRCPSWEKLSYRD